MISKATDLKASSEFRQYLPDLSIPRFTTAKEQDAYQYAEAFQKTKAPSCIYNLSEVWKELYREPFKGVTTDGNIIPSLFEKQDEGVDIKSIVGAVEKVLDKLSPEEKQKVQYPIDAREWRAWSNPEFLLRPFGLRLEDISEDKALSILDVLKAAFSPQGYDKAIAAMRINHFQGDICNVLKVMNKYSYNFLLFGTPSTTEPWGFSLRMGRHSNPPHRRHSRFELMQSLPTDEQKKAVVLKDMYDPAMNSTGDLVKDRWNPDDQRHLCGAFRDNRIVPYEGVCVSSFTEKQKQLVLDIAGQFVLYLPYSARQIRLEQMRSHFDSTYFCWIGGYGDNDSYYFRIQSPVIITQFDHHSGVFLTNKEPAKFHTHTIVRTPNGGDYGFALRKSHVDS
ncbi:hypothetical protein EJ08DRAFT_664968 [Tothia fuscella]|uniref:Uncharacterized protein n=1 Tax=Tothia fuscella TaxID=1048955 RepID=A0A9P4NHE8_9PEZI|nr:hypothetical protein EJ08DRAFT_664968 [Tothia fuscella]